MPGAAVEEAVEDDVVVAFFPGIISLSLCILFHTIKRLMRSNPTSVPFERLIG